MQPVAHSPSVMVVEDDDDLRDMFSTFLIARGYAVHRARHGRDALEQLAVGPLPRLLLVDVEMPIMDGEELCAEWRGRPELHVIPLVLVTANRNAKEICDRCRATAFLGKPVETDLLLRTVKHYAGASAASVALIGNS